MKRPTYPKFQITATVSITEPGSYSSRPDYEIKATCYISFYDDAYSALIRDAKWKMERLGVPKERIDTLYFEHGDTLELRALDAIGVKRVDCTPVEAFSDRTSPKNRATLIRQRRLVPEDQADMLAMYAPKVAAPAQAEAVPA